MKKKILPIVLITMLALAVPTAYALESWVVDGDEWSYSQKSMEGAFLEDGDLKVTPSGWGETLYSDPTKYKSTTIGDYKVHSVQIDLEHRENLKFRYMAETGAHVDGTSISPLPFAKFWINDLETSTEFANHSEESSGERDEVIAYYDVSDYSWTTTFEFWVHLNGGDGNERVQYGAFDNIKIWDYQTGQWVGLHEWSRMSQPGTLEVNADIPSGQKAVFEIDADGSSYKTVTSDSFSQDISDTFDDYSDDVEVEISMYGENVIIRDFTITPEGYDVPPIGFFVRAMVLVLGFAFVGWKFKQVKDPTEGITTGVYTIVFLLFIVVMWIIAPSIEDIVASILYSFG